MGRRSSIGSNGSRSPMPGSPCGRPEVVISPEMLDICRRIDADGNGNISKLELIDAVHRDPVVARYVLPGVDSNTLMSDEASFDAVDTVFDAMANGKQRVRYSDLAAHFNRQREKSLQVSNVNEVRAVYDLIDADGNNSISKLELVAAVMRNEAVSSFVLPGITGCHVMSDEETFDMVNNVFQTIAGGKRRIDYSDFEEHFRKVKGSAGPRRRSGAKDRTQTRVFIIGPGFGQQLNPRQSALITQAGFQTHFCHGIPNPEQPNFPVGPYLEYLRAEIEAFRPDVLACASKGGVYMQGLWQAGYWTGPSLLLNAHPSVMAAGLPENVPIVLAQGSNDEVYPTLRANLEAVMETGTENHCFLYYTANSGYLASGQLTRVGDRHNMESLLSYDTVSRLLDATMCPEGPEVHMVRTWRERLGAERLEAEEWLGYSPEDLRKRWTSPKIHRGSEDHQLVDVPRGSEEFQRVHTVFSAAPQEPPAYLLSPQATWDRTRIVRLQRVENGLQEEASAKPYYDALRRSLDDQGVEFEPGTHTCWAFHGADDNALESIVSNPVAGFQPLASGSRNATLWGPGTYFARDPKYVADGGFCGHPAPDGARRMLMCLMMTGMPCLGDPTHKGVLPFRNRPHRYNCSVDCLAAPEIYIIQHPGAAAPAYLITFA